MRARGLLLTQIEYITKENGSSERPPPKVTACGWRQAVRLRLVYTMPAKPIQKRASALASRTSVKPDSAKTLSVLPLPDTQSY
jgi:hypothetical protein